MSDMLTKNLRTFMEISGLEQDAAKKMLKDNANNLERAINSHLESQNVPESSATVPNIEPVLPNMPDLMSAIAAGPVPNGIRAAIPNSRETLLLPDAAPYRLRKRRVAHVALPQRNLERDAEIQEAQLINIQTADNGHGSGLSQSSNSSTASHTSNPAATNNSVENIAELPFCRPKRRRVAIVRSQFDGKFSGTLHAAREFARQRDRWIIVSLQDKTEFTTQILNRDIWSNRLIKTLIQKYFIFWQVAIDTSEGARFRVFYDARVLPYVCIIDPRTGEEKLSYRNGFKLVAAEFAEELKTYLRENTTHPSGEGSEALNSDLMASDMQSSTVISAEQMASGSGSVSPNENDQLILAIQNSHLESHAATERPRPRAIVTVDSYKKYLGPETDLMTKLVLRLPDGVRHTLEWPSSSRLQAIRLYVEEKYPEYTKETYKILCPYPRKDVLEMDMSLSLIDAKLHPAILLNVHPDD